MFCKQCGKSIPDNSKFCQHCGADQVTVVSPSLTVSNQNGEQNIHSVFSKKFIFGTVVSFLVTTAGIVTVFFPSLLNLEKSDYKIDMAIDTFWHESIVHKIGKVLIYLQQS